MQVIIANQHVDITDTLREYFRRKLTRIDRHFGPVIRCYMVLRVAKNSHLGDPTAHTRGTQWNASTKDQDMYAAIDHVMAKLDRRAIKHKEKGVEHHHDEGRLKNHPNT